MARSTFVERDVVKENRSQSSQSTSTKEQWQLVLGAQGALRLLLLAKACYCLLRCQINQIPKCWVRAILTQASDDEDQSR